MILVAASVIILLLLGVNYAVHGSGCWGFQAGGFLSMCLFTIQVLLSFAGICWGIIYLFRGGTIAGYLVLGIGLILAIAAVYAYCTVGWQLYTSSHFQGNENLPTFLLTSSVAIVLGAHKWATTRARVIRGSH